MSEQASQGQQNKPNRFESSIYDSNTYDGQLIVTASHRKGVWAAELRILGQRARWIAGQLPCCSTAHTLLAAGIIAALRPLTHKNLKQISERTGRHKLRPRLQIVVNDPTFADAIEAVMKRVQSTKRLRTGKSFLVLLAEQLARFDRTFVTEPESKRLMTLKNWAVKAVHDPTIPAAFMPVAASMTA